MELLSRNEKIETYVDIIGTWTDPVIIMKKGKRQEKMTTSSGELELPLGEFIVNENFIENLEDIDILLAELADKNSIERISSKRIKFRLKEELVVKLKEIYHNHKF